MLKLWYVLLSLFLAGCNLASESTQPSPPPPDPELSRVVPEAQIQIVDIPDSRGYFSESRPVHVKVLGKGSRGSTVTCQTVVEKLNTATGVFEADANNGTLADCQTYPIYTGTFPGDLIGALKLKTTVTDANSKTAEAVQYLLVKNDQRYLKADFVYTLHDTGLSIDLDASSSVQGETGAITSYQWKIYKKEDADLTTQTTLVKTATGRQTSVVVPQDGWYLVELTITDAGAQSVTTQQVLHIGNGDALPVSFSINLPAPATAPLNLSVIANTANIQANVDHFVWQVYRIEDGVLADNYLYRNTVERPETTLPIAVPGIYQIRLKIIDVNGNQHQIDEVVKIP